MKRMPTWLSSEAWKVYADSDSGGQLSTQDELEVGYGETIE